MSEADVVQWISCELSKLLGGDADDDVARYLLSIDTAAELEEYLGEILDISLPVNKDFVHELLQRWQHRNGTVPVAATSPITPAKKSTKSLSGQENRSSKTRFVPLFSPEGHDHTAAVIPGRYHCDCQASKHNLVNNCRNCGRVVCEQEGSGPCFFCRSLVCSKSEQELIDRGSKKSERLRDHLMKQAASMQSAAAAADDDDDDGLMKALQHRDKLLEYDKTSAKRTHVIDDESDYFATDSNQWLTSQQRESLRHKDAELRATRHASRRDRKVTLDFAGRRIVEDTTTADGRYTDGMECNGGGGEEQEFNPDDFNVDLVNPNLRLPAAPQFVPAKSWSSAVVDEQNATSVTASLRTLRLQDSELKVMSDEGVALSMHQPWASLLVAGIKRHEGRSWYTAHRGILWIAATSKTPDARDIAAVQEFYRKFYSESHPVFPSSYPTACLLGCVNVGNCLSQADYRQQFAGDETESDSPFVFICDHPRQLVVKFPVRGKHKIYKLERHLHQAAKKCINNHQL